MNYVFVLTYENFEGLNEIKVYEERDVEFTDEELHEFIGDLLHSNPDAISCEFKYMIEED